jgi:hypothetical protein
MWVNGCCPGVCDELATAAAASGWLLLAGNIRGAAVVVVTAAAAPLPAAPLPAADTPRVFSQPDPDSCDPHPFKFLRLAAVCGRFKALLLPWAAELRNGWHWHALVAAAAQSCCCHCCQG